MQDRLRQAYTDGFNDAACLPAHAAVPGPPSAMTAIAEAAARYSSDAEAQANLSMLAAINPAEAFSL